MEEESNQAESKSIEKEELVNENNNLKDNANNQNNKQQLPVRKAPPVPPTSPPALPSQKIRSDQQSNHSYEEIAASEVASEVGLVLIFFGIGSGWVSVKWKVVFLDWFLKIYFQIFRYLKI